MLGVHRQIREEERNEHLDGEWQREDVGRQHLVRHERLEDVKRHEDEQQREHGRAHGRVEERVAELRPEVPLEEARLGLRRPQALEEPESQPDQIECADLARDEKEPLEAKRPRRDLRPLLQQRRHRQ